MIKHLLLCRKAKEQVSLSKNRSLRTSPQTGVAISQLFRPEIDRFNLKTGGFPRQCALLSRNDSNFFDTLSPPVTKVTGGVF